MTHPSGIACLIVDFISAILHIIYKISIRASTTQANVKSSEFNEGDCLKEEETRGMRLTAWVVALSIRTTLQSIPIIVA